ncbi:hypothetical protein [Ochrovirga pacifica]|uniref:hypothetical protein n=1 Tax=Ochrovirga pacifica TaxID=1042376 RepID=UPI0002557FF4|nr:hypothetical protein [Ochrovirga pacifica]
MKWKFAKHTNELDIVGFKDNDIEKFGMNPAKSIVREAIQNSCDAKDHKITNQPVKVIIKTGIVKKNTLPEFTEIESHINACVNSENDNSENEEVKRHIKEFSDNDFYTYLEISDYNTTGMTKKSFESLTQGIFKSNKTNASSQGSKGVGKAVYYASSYLRTMLVSTKNNEGNRFRAAAKLATHTNPNNLQEQSYYKGFYGDIELKKNNEIPDLFKREQLGTSVFIIGFWQINNFTDEVIKEVLRNYWYAIVDNQLEVIVEGQKLNTDNVQKYMMDYFPDYRDYKTGDRQNPRAYYETYINGKCYTKVIDNIGECKLWLHKNEEFNLGAVARFRQTKMLIYKENNLDSGFAGLFLCDNDEGNKFLKEIENDAHDMWSPKINHNLTVQAKKTLEQVKNFIKDMYALYAGLGNKSSFTIDKLDNLFSFSGGTTSGTNKKEVSNIVSIKNDVPRDRVIGKHSFRARLENNKYKYDLIFNANKTIKNQKFKISIGTDSSKDVVNILKASMGYINDNIITLDVKKGDNIIKNIELDCPYLVAPSITSINK